MTKENEIIDYPKGLTFEQVWASIQKLGDKIESLTDKYDAIFEREAKERQEREEREAKERQEREERQAKERQEREAKERREREEREAKERQEREAKERQERQEWLKADEERRKAADERMKKLDEKMGELGNRFGELAEHLVAPNIAEKFNNIGYDFKGVNRSNISIRENGQVVTEIDLLLDNKEIVAIVEVKSKPNKRDIRRHLKRMKIARRWYCEQYGNTHKKFIGAIAGAIFPDNLKRLAIKNGFYVITQTGDTVKIEVPENFKPKIF